MLRHPVIPVQLVRKLWIRLVPSLYLPKLMMSSIRSLFYPLNYTLLSSLQNLFLPTVFISCYFLSWCSLPPISCFFPFVHELEWSLKWRQLKRFQNWFSVWHKLFSAAWFETNPMKTVNIIGPLGRACRVTRLQIISTRANMTAVQSHLQLHYPQLAKVFRS